METTKGRSYRFIRIPEIEIAKSKKESSMATKYRLQLVDEMVRF
ncbi:BnaC08g19620D [Brassica napus]|uniref:BnaC08g19620D protein n=1 Tax=Brassica napus TaxID=3708 RepID=A0A078H842_BRANA|nr:BnaC08g19620D [Brassica napus]